ncbi:MAG: hypothetical protein ABI581_17055, partial [Sediminibacterium sp.]
MKTFVLLISLLLVTTAGFSQKLIHSIGIGADISTTDTYTRTYSSTTIREATTRVNYLGAMYFPRLVLIKQSNSSFSIGTPVTIGISWATLNTFYTYSTLSSSTPMGLISEGSKKPRFAVELPVVADYNMGAGSSRGNKKRTGGYFGAGVAYTYTTVDN